MQFISVASLYVFVALVFPFLKEEKTSEFWIEEETH